MGDDVVSQILDDDKGNLWLGCNRGILRVSKSELHAVASGSIRTVHPLVLDQSDGMLVPECTGGYSPAGLRSRSGMLYFSTVRGVVAVDPARFDSSPAPPPVVIEEVVRDGKPIAWREQSLVLKPGWKALEIHFTAFNSLKSEQFLFRYRLGEKNEPWIDANQKRFLNFSRLEPGPYLFQVSAANQDGHWSPVAATLPFNVQPFFWETNWFRAAVVLVIMAFGAGLVLAAARGKIRRALVSERLTRAEAEARHHLNEAGHLSRVALVAEMATSLAHELNQPLTAIVTNASAAQRFLARSDLNRDELREVLDDISADGHRAGEVIRGIKGLVRKNEGVRLALDLDKVISDVLRLVRADALSHGCEIATELENPLPMVEGDPVQLQQVLLNLIINALDAMAKTKCDPCRVVISSRSLDAQAVEVSVRDFGPGLPLDAPGRVFERFYSTKNEGMGMGLAIARSIVEAHEGTLAAENVEGGGARFWFRLPAQDAPLVVPI